MAKFELRKYPNGVKPVDKFGKNRNGNKEIKGENRPFRISALD
jgi:hypothetical protein